MADPAGLSAAVRVAKLCGQSVPVLTVNIIPKIKAVERLSRGVFPARLGVLPCWDWRSSLYWGLGFPVLGFGLPSIAVWA